jgi:hypothetical protein
LGDFVELDAGISYFVSFFDFRDKNYAEGCKEFLTSCIKFGLLVNRIVRPERGRAFTADGNPIGNQAPYTTRLEMLKVHMDRQEYAEKAKKLRQLEENEETKK